jgi:hypothetical protein
VTETEHSAHLSLSQCALCSEGNNGGGTEVTSRGIQSEAAPLYSSRNDRKGVPFSVQQAPPVGDQAARVPTATNFCAVANPLCLRGVSVRLCSALLCSAVPPPATKSGHKRKAEAGHGQKSHGSGTKGNAIQPPPPLQFPLPYCVSQVSASCAAAASPARAWPSACCTLMARLCAARPAPTRTPRVRAPRRQHGIDCCELPALWCARRPLPVCLAALLPSVLSSRIASPRNRSRPLHDAYLGCRESSRRSLGWLPNKKKHHLAYLKFMSNLNNT